MSNEIFALDIGTRKVMGIVARKTQGCLEVLDVEVIEHESRPMFDGQIHSIEEVAKTVKKVKENLEGRLEVPLKNVGVAVAGRNLVTFKSKVQKEFEAQQEITQGMIRDLEWEAVDRIIRESGKNLSQFYCVGYSPMYHELDGSRIADLLGHRGLSIATEVIATFLPRVVLDSMFAVLKKADLEATNITLEPIAAMGAIIPADMRNLNIVLVDIGAGTSDLALTRDGFVFAFGMVAEAGDEITEHISQILLVDFTTAERIKRILDNSDTVEYADIWGRKHSVDAVTVKQNIYPATKKLAQAISKAGLELNEGQPQAVVAVGGGSLTPHLMEALSYQFGLTLDKVGIRLPSAIKSIKDWTEKLTGPETITPIGIALMTMESLGLRFMNIEVNGQTVRILDFLQKKDVMGALTLSGVLANRKLHARPGLALTVEVNGELKVIKGTFGVPAKVMRNKKEISSLSDKIENGDSIEFSEARDGQDGSGYIKDVVQIQTQQVIFNQEPLLAVPAVLINGQEASLSAPLVDRAQIQTKPLTVRDILRLKGFAQENLSERQILVNINGVPKIVTQRSFTLYLNGAFCDLDTPVNRNDEIVFNNEEPTCYRVKDIIDIPAGFDKMHITVDGKEIDIAIEPMQVLMNGQQVRADEFLIDGADIRIYYLKHRQVILSEIFKYIEFDPYQGIGKKFTILVDGVPAGFTTPLTDGSRVKLLFEDRQI